MGAGTTAGGSLVASRARVKLTKGLKPRLFARQEFQEFFTTLDADGDGLLSLTDLALWVRSLSFVTVLVTRRDMKGGPAPSSCLSTP